MKDHNDERSWGASVFGIFAVLAIAYVVVPYFQPYPMCSTQLEPGLVIDLRDEDGQPIKGAVIVGASATRTTGYKFFENSSPKQAQYEGLHEGDGSYSFTIVKSGYEPYHGIVYLNGPDGTIPRGCHVERQKRRIVLKRT